MTHFDIESLLADTDFYDLNHDRVRDDAIAIYEKNPTEEGLREADAFFTAVYAEWMEGVIRQFSENCMQQARNRHEVRTFRKRIPKLAKAVREDAQKLRREMIVSAIGKHVTDAQIASGKFADLLKDALS